MSLDGVRSTLTDRRDLAGDDRGVPRRYKEVAEGMERQFVKHMIEQMDKTVQRMRSDSSADTYYRSLLHDEIANKVSQNGSLGLQDIILDQIYPRDQRRVRGGDEPYADLVGKRGGRRKMEVEQ